MRNLEPQIQDLIKTRGLNGKLVIDFDGLEFFGSPENTTVIFMKLKESGPAYELLQDINHLLIQAALDNQILEKYELSHVRLNKKTQRYELDQLHCSLVNCSWGQGQLMKIRGRREFIGKEILENNLDLAFEPVVCDTIELSTRHHYDAHTGFYLSQYTIPI